jgi:hypothetical protein
MGSEDADLRSRSYFTEVSKEFGKKLKNSEISMKFIDFGYANTKERIKKSPEDEYLSYLVIMRRLKSLGCTFEKNENMFDVLEFYDFAIIFELLGIFNENGLQPAVVEKEREVATSGCTPGAKL